MIEFKVEGDDQAEALRTELTKIFAELEAIGLNVSGGEYIEVVDEKGISRFFVDRSLPLCSNHLAELIRIRDSQAFYNIVNPLRVRMAVLGWHCYETSSYVIRINSNTQYSFARNQEGALRIYQMLKKEELRHELYSHSALYIQAGISVTDQNNEFQFQLSDDSINTRTLDHKNIQELVDFATRIVENSESPTIFR